MRSMQKVSTIAWWSALAQYFYLIHPLVPSANLLLDTSTIPFVISQYACHAFLSSSIVKLPSPAPPRAANFFVDFKATPAVAGFQKTLSSALNNSRAQALIEKSAPYSQDRARFNSLADKSASYWLSTPPISSNYILSNPSFHAACRLRLGLAPYDDIKVCLCGKSLIEDPLHFLTCNYLRRPIVSRHDRLTQVYAKISKLCGIGVQYESILSTGEEGTRSDLELFLNSTSIHADICAVHPAAPSYLNLANRPGGAARKREREKSQIYNHAATSKGCLFFPSIFDTFGAFSPGTTNLIGRIVDEGMGNGTSSLDGQRLRTYINRSLAFALQEGNANILLTGARLSRSRARNLVG